MDITAKIKMDIVLEKFSNSYIVQTDDQARVVDELKAVIKENIFKIDSSEEHPDLLIISKVEAAKNVSVDQIRELQQFVNRTSIVSGKKVAIITDADQMNINASNCSLKMLEDTPSNTHLFLITEDLARIIPTIKSRCVKLRSYYNRGRQVILEEKFLEPLIKNISIDKRLNFLKIFAEKDRRVWSEFASTAQMLLGRFAKKIAGCDISLSEQEIQILRQFRYNDLKYVLQKHELLKFLIYRVIKYDLELQSSSILLIDQFRN